MSDKDTKLILSGYLPKDEWNGLSVTADDLERAFEKAKSAGDESGDTTRTVVVGILDVESVKIRKNDKPKAVEVRFLRLEPVVGESAATVLELLKSAQEARIGEVPIDGFDDAAGAPERPATGGEATTQGPRRSAKKAAAAPK